MIQSFVVAYDEHRCAWLVDIRTAARIPLAPGMLLNIDLVPYGPLPSAVSARGMRMQERAGDDGVTRETRP